MKKFLTLAAALFTVLVCCFVAACGSEQPDPLVINASDASFSFEDKTLKDYMDFLQDKGEFSYSVSDGMVTSINGTSNTTKSYWMLYTSDSENSNREWGTFEYEGTVYGSATLGLESLPLKEGCIYIWTYQTF